MSHPSTTRPRAFTLLEVAVVVAIAGIMATLAVGSLRNVLSTSKESGAARSVAALIKRARVLAISNHNRVAVVVSTTPNTIKLQSCRAAYGGTAACATTLSLTDVSRASLTFKQGDMKGVVLTGPTEGVALVFDAGGFPENTNTTYTYVLDHTERAGTRKVVVTAAGEVRVQ